MKNIIAILLLVSTMLPARAASPACQPLAGFIKDFETKAKDNGLTYKIYRIDGAQSKDLLIALDNEMGAKSEDSVYAMITGMLVIIAPIEFGYVGVLQKDDICLGAVISMDTLVKALRKIGADEPV